MRWISRRASLISVGLFNLIICCVGLASCISWFCLKVNPDTVSSSFWAGFSSNDCYGDASHGVILVEMALLTFFPKVKENCLVKMTMFIVVFQTLLLQGEGEQLGDRPDGQLHPLLPYCYCPHLQMCNSGSYSYPIRNETRK